MPEGKDLQIQKGEYPKLDDLESGTKIKVNAEATVTWEGDSGKITFDTFNIETENQADKAYKQMKMQPESNENMAGMDDGDGF